MKRISLNNLSISQKFILSYLLIGVCTVALLSVFFYHTFRQSLLERTFAQLSSINVLKESQIEQYLWHTSKQITLMASNPAIHQALTTAPDTAQLMRLQREHEYESVVIFNEKLEQIYPAPPIPTTIRQDPRFRAFLQQTFDSRSLQLSDLSPVFGHTTLLIALPLLNSQGQFTGLFVVNVPIQLIEEVLYERTGIGLSGESYLVGDDLTMRSKSRFFPHTPPLSIRVATESTRQGIAGKEAKSNAVIEDYRHIPVLSVHHRLKVPGLHWLILSEIDLAEAMLPVHAMRNRILVISLAVLALITVLTFYLSGRIANRILQIRALILDLSKGVLPHNKLIVNQRDEIGQMKEAIHHLVDGLQRTSDFAAQIGTGDFETSFEPLSAEDTLGNSLITMREQLKAAKERERHLNRQRTAALLEGQENERRRIARELHDGVGQLLTATKLRVGLLEEDEEMRAEISGILEETITEVRRISYNLMPSVLMDFGLESALKSLCLNTEKLTNLTIQYQYHHPSHLPLPEFETAVSLYRIAQEGMNNIIKHAEANTVELTVTQEEKFLRMLLKDNGKGFDPASKSKDSNGLRNIQERVQLLHGHFALHTKPGEGTQLILEIPLHRA